MDMIENLLDRAKHGIDRLEVPDELASRLRDALKTRPGKQPAATKWKMKAAVGLIVLLLVGYNFDALAFYGRKLIGYDQVMNGTLKQLNELGKGQVIGKSFTFKNRVIVTLDGVMLDENQMLLFYSVKDSHGHIDEVDLNPFMTVKGMFGSCYIKNASGEMNKDKTEIKYIASFETPFFLEKKLHFSFALFHGVNQEPGEISFTLDRNKAMGYTLKKTLNQFMKADENKIRIESIIASPTKTVVSGSIQNIAELALDQIRGERFRPNELQMELLANGKPLREQGGGLSTDMKGITFHMDYDALPPDLKKLQIRLKAFGADHDVYRQTELKKEEQSRVIRLLGQNIEINNISEKNGDTYLTITTLDSVVLSRVYLLIDGRKTELQETISDKLNKEPDGTLIHTRMLHFPGMGERLTLDVERMRYTKKYNELINVPLN